MSLIQAGRLVLPGEKNAPSTSSNGTSMTRAPLPYLGPVGTIPFSTETTSIHHHPGAEPGARTDSD